MNDYFFLSNNIKPKTAIAFSETRTRLAYEIIPELIGKTEIPFELSLKKVKKVRGQWQEISDLSGLKYLWLDYQPNDLAWNLFSDKMKNIIEKNLSGKEGIVWMSVKIKSEVENKTYYIPRFQKMLDVLDEQKTLFVKGTNHIIKPVFSLSKVLNYNLFHEPQDHWEIPSGLYVNKSIKNAIQKEKLTGVGFENTTVE